MFTADVETISLALKGYYLRKKKEIVCMLHAVTFKVSAHGYGFVRMDMALFACN